jgi:hypothetical protein
MGLTGCSETSLTTSRKSKELKGDFADVRAMKTYGEVES